MIKLPIEIIIATLESIGYSLVSIEDTMESRKITVTRNGKSLLEERVNWSKVSVDLRKAYCEEIKKQIRLKGGLI